MNSHTRHPRARKSDVYTTLFSHLSKFARQAMGRDLEESEYLTMLQPFLGAYESMNDAAANAWDLIDARNPALRTSEQAVMRRFRERFPPGGPGVSADRRLRLSRSLMLIWGEHAVRHYQWESATLYFITALHRCAKRWPRLGDFIQVANRVLIDRQDRSVTQTETGIGFTKTGAGEHYCRPLLYADLVKILKEENVTMQSPGSVTRDRRIEQWVADTDGSLPIGPRRLHDLVPSHVLPVKALKRDHNGLLIHDSSKYLEHHALPTPSPTVIDQPPSETHRPFTGQLRLKIAADTRDPSPAPSSKSTRDSSLSPSVRSSGQSDTLSTERENNSAKATNTHFDPVRSCLTSSTMGDPVHLVEHIESAEFIRRANSGDIFHVPLVVKQTFADASLHTLRRYQEELRGFFGDQTYRSGSSDSELRYTGPTSGAEMPFFARLSRFRLLDKLLWRCHQMGSTRIPWHDVQSGFGLTVDVFGAKPNQTLGPHVNAAGGMWVRCLFGRAEWTLRDSRPSEAGDVCIRLCKDMTLFIPSGATLRYTVSTEEPCLMQQGTFWDMADCSRTLTHIFNNFSSLDRPFAKRLPAVLEVFKDWIEGDETAFPTSALTDVSLQRSLLQILERFEDVGCGCHNYLCDPQSCLCYESGMGCTDWCFEHNGSEPCIQDRG